MAAAQVALLGQKMVISQYNLPEIQKKNELIHTFCLPQCLVNYHFKLKCGKSSGHFNMLRFRTSRIRTPAENTQLCSLLSRHEMRKVSARWAKFRLGWRGGERSFAWGGGAEIHPAVPHCTDH